MPSDHIFHFYYGLARGAGFAGTLSSLSLTSSVRLLSAPLLFFDLDLAPLPWTLPLLASSQHLDRGTLDQEISIAAC